MNTSSVKLYSFGYSQVKTYATAALFVLGNIVLPQLCHLIPDGGRVFLPIYFFTLLAACKYGWRVGLLTALLSPAANTLLFGMPALAALPVIMVKSSLLALAAGFAVRRFGKASIAVLAGAVLASQIVGSLFEWAWTGSATAAVQDFRLGFAGMALQVAGCWAIIGYILKR